MNSKEKTDLSFSKAENYAFRLLKFRMRSEKELYQRLKRKKFEEGTIERVIAFLKEKGFINDMEFAKAWVESRMKRPLGFRRINEELQTKGVDKKIIEDTLATAKSNYNEDDIVLELAKKRLKRLAGLEPRKIKSRLYSYLLRRGFSPDIVSDIINQVILIRDTL